MRRGKIVIDKSNWTAHKVLVGDYLLNGLGERIAEVINVVKSGKKRGVVRVRTLSIVPMKGRYEYDLDGGRSNFERLIECMGYRFERETIIE